MQKTYSTKELANIVGVHVNTLRFYEKIGFLTKPERKENGYRIYTDIHLEQCKVIRLAMKAEVLQNGLRKKAVEIVQLCAEKRFDDSIAASKEYLTMIENEMAGAQRAIIAVEGMLSHNEVKNGFCSRSKGSSKNSSRDAGNTSHLGAKWPDKYGEAKWLSLLLTVRYGEVEYNPDIAPGKLFFECNP